MKKVLFVGLALGIVAIVVTILVGMRDEDPKPVVRHPPPRPDARPRIALPQRAPLPDGAQILPVRDHRDLEGEDRPDPDILPSTVAAMRPVLLPIVKKCAIPLRSQVPVPKGRLVVTTHVKAVNGKVSVADVAVRQDLVNDQDLVACVTKEFQRAVIEAPPEQDDGEQDVTMAFPVP